MPLEIYKASAGSGKTFQIVSEYLKLVFRRPGAYKNILAVTFTNKATAEMKDRILKELYVLSSGKPSGHLGYLMKEASLTENEVRYTAGRILKLILHDYSRFSISTIDSLFQRVIRAFSREMHLNPNYRTQIDNKEVLEEAVNLLFLEIDQNEELRNWMLEYTEENLRDGKKWNLTDELIKRGSELFKEEFKQFSASLLNKLADKNYLSNYNRQLKEIVDQYESSLKEIGKKAIQLIRDHQLTTEQFKFGDKSFAKHFEKLAAGNFAMPGKRSIDACNNFESWFKSSDSAELKSKIEGVYEGGLNSLLVDSIEEMNVEGVTVNSAKAILDNLFSFGLLTDIALKIDEISKDKNIMLLQDSTSILQRVINGNDSPFVYEKMGTVYRHFMLDEFQDTSNLQWRNLRPLLENSLSEGNKSMVVGDVKQSIYRWRNGDWNLLAKQLEQDFTHFSLSEKALNVNWRSSKNIIDFNNIIFKEASGILNDSFESAISDTEYLTEDIKGIIRKLYAEHYQYFSDKVCQEGFIRVKFIEEENDEKNIKKEDFQKAAIQELLIQLESVQDRGVPVGDIAILVRSKHEGALVAEALLERKYSSSDSHYCYDFISNDTLIIDQSPVVKFILNFFSLFVNPDNDIAKADLIYSYYHSLMPHMGESNEPTIENSLHAAFNIHNEIPRIFRHWFGDGDEVSFDEELVSLPLYNLAARIAGDFNLEKIKGELIYLDAFLDLVLQFTKEESGGISSFLDWWELTGKDKTVSLSEGQNAITILTIHKAKGLEFNTVFVPFCDWELVPSNSKVPYMWCHPDREPFNQLDLVLVKYGSQLERSLFAQAYYKEMLYSMVDNLNILYVAFTRAVNTLIITCPYNSKNSNAPRSIGNIVQRIIENPSLLDSIERESYLDMSPYWNPDSKVFEYGDSQKIIAPDKKKSATNHEFKGFRIGGNEGRLKLRVHSEGYFDIYKNEISERISFGRMLHEIFENISTADDINNSVKSMVSAGMIDSETAKEYMILIERMLSFEPQKSWFNGEWQVLNERNIIRGKENSHRPDRIMLKDGKVILIDYKTGEKHENHISQVKGYLNDFEKMGYGDRKGYLWYLNSNELVEV